MARPAIAVQEATRLTEVAERLRTGPYTTLAVVGDAGDVRGIITAQRVAEILLAATTPEERADVRMWPACRVMEPPTDILPLGLLASDAIPRLKEAKADALPVADFTGQYIGMVALTDFVPELLRSVRPPMIGGMATPAGVYLTTGAVSGGVSKIWLAVSGLLLSGLYLAAYLLTRPLENTLLTTLREPFLSPALSLLQMTVQILLLLLIVRVSPVAGYHAAEHQVAHAVERGEPLVVDAVRQMPRVHPRCGTNVVAGAILFYFGGLLLEPFLQEAGYLASGIVALLLWRTLGAWFQRHLTTRPATDAQIQSGINAAQEILQKSERVTSVPRFPVRLWHMGFPAILAGFFAGSGLFYVLGWLVPTWQTPLHAYVRSLW